MKKYIRLILTACLALCMVLCLGLAVACQNTNENTFTINVIDEDGNPVADQVLQYCDATTNCIPVATDSNGQVKFDISTDVWKNSPYVHIKFFDLDGKSVYDKDGNICENNEDYVDHKSVKSVTYTLKVAQSEEIEADPIVAGYN